MKKQKIRVLQANKLYYPTTGGIERVVQEIAEGLNSCMDMKVLVCQEKGKSISEKVNGVTVVRAKSYGVVASLPISFDYIRKLRKMSKEADIIQFHMPFPIGDLACLLSGYKGKVVVWWHSDIVRQKTMMRFYRPIMELFLKRADVIITAAQGNIDGSSYIKKYESKCRVIPFGVNPKIEEQAKQYELSHYSEGYSKDKEVNFLFIGRLVYYKGCEVLLNAFLGLEGATLTIIGDGPLREEMLQFIKKNHIENQVTMVGKVSDEELGSYLGACDVFVLPSIVKSEAFGLVQLEAMVYQKPVINTWLESGVPEVSINDITGKTVKPGDVLELHNAMQWMINHKEERRMMGERARKRVEEEFTIEKMLDNIKSLYEEILDSK